MTEGYKTIYLPGEGEIVEKKSRFIATTALAESEEDALAFIEAMRKKYWNATHNCWAYVTGPVHGAVMRCSDDGEPQGTAGRPMLDVLLGEELYNICVVVTRYFGGTLLGTGGLVRAYSKAVQAGLAGSRLIRKEPGRKLHVICDYNWIGKIQYQAAQSGVVTLDTQYTDRVETVLLVPEKDVGQMTERLVQATGAKVVITAEDQVWFAVDHKKVLLFDH